MRDLLKEILQKIFGEEMGGSGGPRPPYQRSQREKDNDYLNEIVNMHKLEVG